MTRQTVLRCCLVAQAVFQIAIAGLLLANREETAKAFASKSFMSTPQAAQGAVVGALGVHIFLAVAAIVLAVLVPRARLATRIVATVILAGIAIGGVAAMSLPSQTYLSPIGVALAVAALVLLWWPASGRPAD